MGARSCIYQEYIRNFFVRRRFGAAKDFYGEPTIWMARNCAIRLQLTRERGFSVKNVDFSERNLYNMD
ncbi:MAG: hypothetical protein J6L72_11630, partial [Butyricicoccus sp.]|nr:hypothetical protein [Butyricicoccus sp.]